MYSTSLFVALCAAVAVSLLAGILTYLSPQVGADCGGVKTAIIDCNKSGGGNIEDSGLMGLLEIVINIMAISVGVLAVGTLVFAGVMYASAGDSQDQVQKAKGMIRNTIIGLVLFAGMYSIIEFLVPGGVF